MLAKARHGVYNKNMVQREELSRLVERLLELEPSGRAGLASKLGVSEATIGRWLHGQSRPHPTVEGKLRDLGAEQSALVVREPTLGLFDWHDASKEEDLRTVLGRALRQLRECLHRSARLSSRHEALDELAKLLFAHVMSIDSGGPGISATLLDGRAKPAQALRLFVSEIFSSRLPKSLAHELTSEDFSLQLRTSEDRFAAEIVECFQPIARPEVTAQLAGPESVDVLNEAFGQFLADSFVEEKELGQYLTPTEVVKFMTRLGLNSLPELTLELLCHPTQCKQAGVILDPSCGVGSFLSEVLRVLHSEVLRKHGETAAGRWLEAMMGSVVVGIDKSERMIRLALTNLALFGVPCANLHLANALVRDGQEAQITDALEGKVRLILTNPPFGAEFPAEMLGRFRIATEWTRKKLRAVDSEILFLERYIDWLAPGGVLIAIVPDSILTNKGLFEDLRRGLSSTVELKSVISLPVVTFGAAGTSTKTSILHLVKKDQPPKRTSVYFAICEHVGYEVATRSSQRQKIANGTNDLLEVLPEACREKEPRLGRVATVSAKSERWDATYHASLPQAIVDRLSRAGEDRIHVRDVASLSSERADPRRDQASGSFNYIEISDVDGGTRSVRSTLVLCSEAPTRARKVVHAGDILVSTVRPERRTIGVVPDELDRAICSTGFAVLRTSSVDPMVLAALLQTDFATEQILRNNIGIAYPAVSEECLLEVLLPVSKAQLRALSPKAEEVRKRAGELRRLYDEFSASVAAAVDRWVNSGGPGSR